MDHDRARHRKEGERGATRSPFLAVRIEHVPKRPDLIQLRGYWILSVDEFFSTYVGWENMRRTDPISKKSIDELNPGAFILDLNWPDVQGYMHAEPSISVHRSHDVDMMWQDDPDGVTLTHMIRRHLHGVVGACRPRRSGCGGRPRVPQAPVGGGAGVPFSSVS